MPRRCPPTHRTAPLQTTGGKPTNRWDFHAKTTVTPVLWPTVGQQILPFTVARGCWAKEIFGQQVVGKGVMKERPLTAGCNNPCKQMAIHAINVTGRGMGQQVFFSVCVCKRWSAALKAEPHTSRCTKSQGKRKHHRTSPGTKLAVLGASHYGKKRVGYVVTLGDEGGGGELVGKKGWSWCFPSFSWWVLFTYWNSGVFFSLPPHPPFFSLFLPLLFVFCLFVSVWGVWLEWGMNF